MQLGGDAVRQEVPNMFYEFQEHLYMLFKECQQPVRLARHIKTNDSFLLYLSCRHVRPQESINLYFQITANKMQLLLHLFIFTDTVHVLGGSSAHHKEHIIVNTASNIVNQYCC
jgi:hypothetical protein